MGQEAHFHYVTKFMVDGGTKSGDMFENLDVRTQDGGNVIPLCLIVMRKARKSSR